MGDEEIEEERKHMKKMTLAQHLEELRYRIIVSLVATVLGSTAFLVSGSLPLKIAMNPYLRTWSWLAGDWMEKLEEGHRKGTLPPSQEEVYQWVFGKEDPGTRTRKGGHREEILAGKVSDGIMKAKGFLYPRRLAQLGPIEYIVAWMKVALIFGLILASPVVFHQMWKFVGAGLYKKEKRVVMSYLPFTVGLFLAGASFAFFFMIPYALYFLARFSDPELVNQTYTIKAYFSFFFTVTLAMSLVFQLPILMLGVAKVGIMSASSMAKKRKAFILGAFIFGAVMTPPDPFTQIFMAVPIVLLFEIGLFLARRVEKKRKEEPQGAPA